MKVLFLNKTVRGLKSSLIFFSAVSLGAAFFGFIPGVFYFLAPLYWLSCKQKLTFFDGFMWGLLFFTIHSFGVFYVVLGQGVGLFRLLCPLLFMSYCALHSGIWFWAVQKVASCSVFTWVLMTVTYFWWIDQGLFWIFGKFEGYLLAFPLVPLMSLPQMAYSISIIGKWGLLICLVIFQVLLVKSIQTRRTIVLTILCLLPFTYGFFVSHTETVPAWVKDTRFVPLPKEPDPYERAVNLVKTLANKPEVKLFVLPETFFPVPLTNKSLIIRILQDHILQNEQLCVVGTHKQINEKLYNSFFVLDQRRIILSYEKTHLIPFFEFNPYNGTPFATLFNFFLHQKVAFSCADSKLSPVCYGDVGPFLPAICSELFCSRGLQKEGEIPFLWIVNDSYFGSTNFPLIMRLLAQFQAISLNQSLAYCASSSAYFIGKNGRILQKIEKI